MDQIRREDLQALLVSHRTQLDPEDAGLGPATRRRGTGLRQDQVATLAGVGPRWYGALERGEVDSPTPDLLGAVAEALRMSAADYDLFLLLASRRRPVGVPEPVTAEDGHHLALERAVPHPAVLTDHTGTVLAANAPFNDWARGPGGAGSPVNLLLWLFGEDAAPVMADIGDARRRVIAHARHACVRHPGSEQLHAVLKELLTLPGAADQWSAWTGSPASRALVRQPLLTGARCQEGELLPVRAALSPGAELTVLLRP